MIKPANQCEHRAGVKEPPVRLLVIGCGNPLAGDDSAGVEIVRRLRVRGNWEGELREMPRGGVELLEVLQEADVVLFVDAVTSGAPPGTLHLVPLPWAGVEPRALASLSSHGWGLTETLKLARALGRRIPRLALLGVEVQTVSPGGSRSPAVEQAIALVVENFPRLRSLLRSAKLPTRRFPRRLAGFELVLS